MASTIVQTKNQLSQYRQFPTNEEDDNPSLLDQKRYWLGVNDCPVCHNFKANAFAGHKLRPFSSIPENEAGEHGFLVDSPVTEILSQVSQGCNGCSLLYQGFLKFWTSELESTTGLDKVYLEAKFVPGKVTICKAYKDVEIGYKFRSLVPLFTFQIFAIAEKPNPWAALFRAPSCPSFVLTDERRACFQSWIQGCIKDHPLCTRPRYMPKRLIDLGNKDGNGNLCLRGDIASTSRYIALSHNWKFSEAYKTKTLKANLGQRKRCMPQGDLSQTFRDAIAITRWLGVRYLWIDTFCIIQDCDVDWGNQVAKMGSIYEGAYVTISVQYDPNGCAKDGCFLERKSFSEVIQKDPSGNQFSTFIKHPYSHDLTKPSALMSRGWCIQERLLSPRILHFRQWEVIFECFTHSRCECETLSFNIDDGYNMQMPEKRLAGTFLLSRSAPPKFEGPPPVEWWKPWKDIIAVYSTSDLSYKTDRLLALSSLAQRMPESIFGKYLAGLWTGNLIDQLAWGHNVHDKLSRPEHYIAPSFSWASVCGGPIRWYYSDYLRSSRRTAQIIETSTKLANVDPMGAVKEGFIRMKARVFSAIVQGVDKDTTNMKLEHTCKSATSYICSANFDTEDDKASLVKQSVYIAELFNAKEQNYFLVLRNTGEREEKFERVGCGSFSKTTADLNDADDCFSEAGERYIMLV